MQLKRPHDHLSIEARCSHEGRRWSTRVTASGAAAAAAAAAAAHGREDRVPKIGIIATGGAKPSISIIVLIPHTNYSDFGEGQVL